MTPCELTQLTPEKRAERDLPRSLALENTGDHWWLGTTWLRHRHAIEAVHPLLVALGEARGSAFMTCGHVLDVLDANDPEALVRGWIETRPSGKLGLPGRTCLWLEHGESCDQPVRAANARFCEAHAAASKRRSDREQARRVRRGKSNPSPALGNQRFAEGPDPLPGSQVFGRQSSPSTGLKTRRSGRGG